MNTVYIQSMRAESDGTRDKESDMEYNLERFRKAQSHEYETALQEIRNGRKVSHWIWYIFPQLKELGYSSTAKYYGLDGRGEAKAYIEDDVLRGRLIEMSEALLSIDSSDPLEVMGYPDNLKLRSCMTLFAVVSPETDVFSKVLDKFFSGEKDEKTVALLRKA